MTAKKKSPITKVNSKCPNSDLSSYSCHADCPGFQIRLKGKDDEGDQTGRIRIQFDTSKDGQEDNAFARVREGYVSYDMELPVLEALVKDLKAQAK